MQGDTLYSVKWYKDDLEFYRFVPNDRPMLQVFPQNGIQVDRTKSNKQHVHLTNLSLESTGTYKCEVSAEAPNFRTKSAHQDMVVVVVPESAEIVGTRPMYFVGDTVNVTCYSYKSRPSASLSWRINGQEVTPEFEKLGDYLHYEKNVRNRDMILSGNPYYGSSENKNDKLATKLNAKLKEYRPKVEKNNLETSALGLTFKVGKQYLGIGLKLECTVAIGSVYWQSFNAEIPVELKEQSSVSNSWWISSSGERPTILGASSYTFMNVLSITIGVVLSYYKSLS
ncbi:uncharacterized protein [Lepeophtheirus salmonis]|nr:uncharacterized protein LOC121124634 isoform X2 [Lepeophtheirus salmonis]